MYGSSALAIASLVEPPRHEAQAAFAQGRISCGHDGHNPA
jgi:hypothetical protein